MATPTSPFVFDDSPKLNINPTIHVGPRWRGCHRLNVLLKTMNTPAYSEFVAATREFCALAEEERPLDETDLWTIRGLLLRLIFHVPAIDAAPHDTKFDGVSPDDATYQRISNRFRDFVFNFYRVVFDPHDLEATDEPVVGMLSDDLTDIYRDLSEGLSNYEQGHPDEACFDWSFSYRSHWARHAVNALAAIEIYRTDNHKNVEQGGGGNRLKPVPHL